MSSMEFSLTKTEQAKPEVRLAVAVSEFEADLNPEQKASFRNHRSQSCESLPTLQDVMQITAEFNRQSSSARATSRCWGTRLTNFLEAVQQYAAIGDVIVGGSQNIIACGVWTLVRMTLLSVVARSSRIAEMTTFFMSVGRSAPRHDRLALLYPQSKRLRAYISEYYILVVRFCHKLLTIQRKPAYLQLVSFTDDVDLKAVRSELEDWAASIKDEAEMLRTEEHTFNLRELIRSSDIELHRRRLSTNARVLRMCSLYDYRSTWKEIRKVGTTTLFNGTPGYRAWKGREESRTLVCKGRLGSGKSVCLANIVDDLNLSQGTAGYPVAFFFCRHDISESLQMHTVLASLAHQLMRQLPDLTAALEVVDETLRALDLSDILRMLLHILPKAFAAYFVLDGLDECDELQTRNILQLIRHLQDKFTLLVCISWRSNTKDPGTPLAEFPAEHDAIEIPEDNPDIDPYITAELERRLEDRQLVIGDPELIVEIRDTLLEKAQGMFLWVALQIESLCEAKTDEAIRRALTDLPRDLPETYSRILKRSTQPGNTYQRRIFELVLAARRPLTAEELREALSVTPGDATWRPERVVNDIVSTLACCGSLAIIDEESSAVRLIHHSVKQFLAGDFENWDIRYLWLRPTAEVTMADVVVTYLNYGVFAKQLSKTVTPYVESGAMPSKIVSSLGSSNAVRSMALKLLKKSDQSVSRYNVNKALLDLHDKHRAGYTEPFQFYAYAKEFWLVHLWHTSAGNVHLQRLQNQLLDDMIGMLQQGDTTKQEIFFLVAMRGHYNIVSRLLDDGAQVRVPDRNGSTALSLAAEHGHDLVASLLLDHGAEIDAKCGSAGLTALGWAAMHHREEVVRTLLKRGAKIGVRSNNGRTPLACAAAKEPLSKHDIEAQKSIIRMLIDRGAEVNAVCDVGATPLHWAATCGAEHAVDVLIEDGADIDARDKALDSPLSRAARNGHDHVIRTLIRKGADVDGRVGRLIGTPLFEAAVGGYKEAVQVLISFGASVDARNSLGQTALLEAIKVGRKDAVRVLLQHGASVHVQDKQGQTPVSFALRFSDGEMAAMLRRFEMESEPASNPGLDTSLPGGRSSSK